MFCLKFCSRQHLHPARNYSFHPPLKTLGRLVQRVWPKSLHGIIPLSNRTCRGLLFPPQQLLKMPRQSEILRRAHHPVHPILKTGAIGTRGRLRRDEQVKVKLPKMPRQSEILREVHHPVLPILKTGAIGTWGRLRRGEQAKATATNTQI